MATVRPRIRIDDEKVADFCRRWKIMELAFFGSVLRDDFGPESDVDVLVTFAPDVHWTLFDVVEMQTQLEAIFGRAVDIVERRAVEKSRNYIRRKSILESAVIRQLEIVGEAARAISDETKAANRAIPWSTSDGMRDILLHEYFRVDVTRVWETVRDDIPPLIAALEGIVPPDD